MSYLHPAFPAYLLVSCMQRLHLVLGHDVMTTLSLPLLCHFLMILYIQYPCQPPLVMTDGMIRVVFLWEECQQNYGRNRQ